MQRFFIIFTSAIAKYYCGYREWPIVVQFVLRAVEPVKFLLWFSQCVAQLVLIWGNIDARFFKFDVCRSWVI